MMGPIFVTRDGSRWMPEYLTAIDGTTCIGCGRCFKVCSREVMHLHGIDDTGEILGICDGQDDDFDGELNRIDGRRPCRLLHWLRSLWPRLPEELPDSCCRRQGCCVILRTNQENSVALQNLLSPPAARRRRQRPNELLRLAFHPHRNGQNDGCLAPSSSGLFRKHALSHLAV